MTQAAASLRAETLPLTSFVDEGRTLSLSKPLVLQISVEDGAYFVENEPLHLFAKGLRSRKLLKHLLPISFTTGATTTLSVMMKLQERAWS